jgi:hypothetical protein
MTVWRWVVVLVDHSIMGWGECYFIIFGLRLGNCDLFERVVDFAGFAVDFLDHNGGRHRGGELRARWKLSMSYVEEERSILRRCANGTVWLGWFEIRFE